MKVRLTGNEELGAKLKQMKRGTKNEKLRQAIRPGAETVLREARRRAPVLSGELRDSLRIVERQSARVDIESPLLQAPVIEFGWPSRGIKPQPYMRPAIHENRDEVFDEIEGELQEIMGL